jgi:hypothetical protein
VQAVHEMLSSAGINMDMEQQSLLQRTITLQEQLQESRAALLLEQVCNLQFRIISFLIHQFKSTLVKGHKTCINFYKIMCNLKLSSSMADSD